MPPPQYVKNKFNDPEKESVLSQNRRKKVYPQVVPLQGKWNLAEGPKGKGRSETFGRENN
jgi:hypothetical protein